MAPHKDIPAVFFPPPVHTRESSPQRTIRRWPGDNLTVGATDGFAKAIEALSNTWNEEKDLVKDREGLLCEEFAYMNAVQAARPRGLNIVPVAIDEEGMKASGDGGLEDVLKNWDPSKGKRPHLIYTVT
jgi:DNA-binding transcriptional MocR family regulator